MKNNIKIVSLSFFMVLMLTNYSLAQPSNGDCSSAIPTGRTMRKTDSIVLHQFVSMPIYCRFAADFRQSKLNRTLPRTYQSIIIVNY